MYGDEDTLPDAPATGGYRTPMERPSALGMAVRTAGRLVLPVLALVGVFLAAGIAAEHPVTLFDRFPADQAERNPSAWLHFGYFVVPFIFFVIHLTNRALGPGMALAQVVISWAVIAAALTWAADRLAALPLAPLPAAEIQYAFLGALFAGQLVAIWLFHMTRGPSWWKAPFFGGVFGGVVYVGLFHTLTGAAATLAIADGVINVGLAVLLLIPYWMLRAAIRPLPGYGGA